MVDPVCQIEIQQYKSAIFRQASQFDRDDAIAE